jgi:transcriptional regulator with XRE-family HTH domain
MEVPQYQPYEDPERLSKLYWNAGMSQKEIAQAFGVSTKQIKSAMTKYDIQTRRYSKYAPYTYDTNGYAQWKTGGKTVRVHQLLAIAEGYEPGKVFSNGEYEIHHQNGVKWDNRPDNIELLTASDHMAQHHEAGDIEPRGKEYTDDELLEWIDAFVKEFGFPPTEADTRDWPGPSGKLYEIRFGSWTNAVKEAGHTPRGER